MNTILTARNIKKRFGALEILKGINLSIAENQFVAILGPSGSGKSTLLNILSGLNRPTSGEIICKDVEVTGLNEAKLANWKRNRIGNVFQNYLLLNHLNAGENIKIGISPDKTPLSFDRLVRMLKIEDTLTKTLLNYPADSSSG